MFSFLPTKPLAILVSIASCSLAAAEEKKKEQNAIERIPDGANLSKVTIPSFDQNLRPTSLLTAELVQKISNNKLTAQGLHVRFFDENTQIARETYLQEAEYLIREKRLKADHEIILRSPSDGFLAMGQGGVFQLDDQRGVLLGHVRTTFQISRKKKPAMKTSLLLLGSLQLLTAAPPAPLTPREKIEFERALALTEIPPSTAKETWQKLTKTSQEINQDMLAYLALIGRQNLIAQAQTPTENKTPSPQPGVQSRPLITQAELTKLLTPGENRFVINATKGNYFDGKAGHLVYLGDITLQGRGITLTCHKELKVIFNKPKPSPDKKKTSEKQEDKAEKKDLFGDFQGVGDLKQLIITGKIEVVGKNNQGEIIGAKANHALYDAAKDQMVLRGGNLVFRNGGLLLFSNDPDAYVTIRLKDESIHNEGNWTTAAPTENLTK